MRHLGEVERPRRGRLRFVHAFPPMTAAPLPDTVDMLSALRAAHSDSPQGTTAPEPTNRQRQTPGRLTSLPTHSRILCPAIFRVIRTPLLALFCC